MTQVTLDLTFAGELISPDHPGYDKAREICNGMFDKRPALIARCTSAMDVVAALAHARAHHLEVAVRGADTRRPGTRAATTGS